MEKKPIEMTSHAINIMFFFYLFYFIGLCSALTELTVHWYRKTHIALHRFIKKWFFSIFVYKKPEREKEKVDLVLRHYLQYYERPWSVISHQDPNALYFFLEIQRTSLNFISLSPFKSKNYIVSLWILNIDRFGYYWWNCP